MKDELTSDNVETFSDGSTITTNIDTSNRTVYGKLAHDEYFRRLEQERFTNAKPEGTNGTGGAL